MTTPPRPHRTRRPMLIGAGLLALAAGAVLFWLWRDSLPRPGSERYEAVTRAFYSGLAAMDVGLLDDARGHLARAAEIEPREPASFANLGVANLRLGDLDAAAGPIEQALALAPDHAGIALLAGRMEATRGRLDEGVRHLRRAVALDPGSLRARFALAEEVERSAAAGADDEAQALVDAIVADDPDNLAALVERTRLAAKRGDAERLRESVARLDGYTSTWPPLAVQQVRTLETAVAATDDAAAAGAVARLRNVLLAVPAFLDDLASLRIPAELIAEPIDRFLVLAPVRAVPAEPDTSLGFVAAPFETEVNAAQALTAAFLSDDEDRPALFAVGADRIRRIDAAGEWPAPELQGIRPSAHSLLALDWDNDFLTDLLVAGAGGVRLLAQEPAGTFTDVTARAGDGRTVACDCAAAWAADVEMDGDLDVILAPREGGPIVLRNRGDGTWETIAMFAEVTGARAFVWADLDQDADPDAAFLDAGGALHVFLNRQAGEFVRVPIPSGAATLALTAGDADADGQIDLVVLDEAGVVRRFSLGGDSSGRLETLAWDVQTLGAWDRFGDRPPAARGPGLHRLFTADLDNNGAIDLVASDPAGTQIWLASETHTFLPLPAPPAIEVFAVADTDGDGRLDLIGLDGERPTRLLGRGDRSYHWKAIRARAQAAAGDQRINSFGIGGDIAIRSGLLAQKQVLTGAPAHFGLGTWTTIDVARVVWPNGVAQAEFDLGVDDTIVAEQRLKGSCPWVFAYDGTGLQFVTDFLWRSPLGLRINARDTAGVTQTEDWIRIRGDQLAPRDGVYDIRITAELWETHFVDHVSLLVMDAPPGAEAFVDERFSPARPPALAVQALAPPRPVEGAWDGAGRDVSALVTRQDGRYLAAFARGAYQGIAEEHVVEFAVEERRPSGPRRVLIAHGWVYPTDSSINVAIGQGGRVRPMGVSLEALDAEGRWVVVDPDIGFPAGKNKTMLVDLDGTEGATRLRLRTNLEIAWDWLATADIVDAPIRTQRLAPSGAELRYRGFSETVSPRGDAPETPRYDRIAGTGQRWRDLTGYYTRFGDVRELLAGVDDRYFIMNAGDELRLRFEAPPAPPDGWRRDFVLVGDGWVKDGDYNTSFSQTVLPLPSHADTAYATPPGALEDDPMYQRHREDWERYHTRWVTPRAFTRGLQTTARRPAPEGTDGR